MTIEYGVWGLRLALGVVFGLAAVGKFADPAGTRKAVGEFGVPIRWTPLVSRSLPIAETLVVVLLVSPWTGFAGALFGLALLLAFTVAVTRLLRQGKHPSCACFGAASTAPIGRATLLRNAALIALALVTAVGVLAEPGVPGSLPVDHAIGMVVTAVFAALFTRLAGELRAVRRRLDEQALSTLGAEGLPVGAVAPEFELLNTAGGRTDLAALLAPGRSLLLVFVHPGCEMCAALARELPRWQARAAATLTIAVVGNGELEPHTAWAREQGLGEIPMLVQRGNEAALRYRVRGTPSGVLIGPDGRMLAAVARGAMAIRDLIVQAKQVAPQYVSGRNGQSVSNTG
ncbi:MauE/DoxX family redox-associated membrane protein [Nocardia sp. NPDC052001]|uniref:MauE/DoxX family redox-associated membrane protein n=1 Tax=Nocardia sp. NPDC052001 TaxID=3154853 RepID=UPI00342B6E24